MTDCYQLPQIATSVGRPNGITLNNEQLMARLKDVLYQRSHTLRKKIDNRQTADEFCRNCKKLFRLSDTEMGLLRTLLPQGDSLIDSRSFISSLRGTAEQNDKLEKERFGVLGVMDRKIQKMLINNQGLSMGHSRPANVLGNMNVHPPFGVLGDGERMGSMQAAYLDMKADLLLNSFALYDPTNTGRISHSDFKLAMKSVDNYIFDTEISRLIKQFDRKKRGYIEIRPFINGVGSEYLKKKADRCSLTGDPLVWEVSDQHPKMMPPRGKLKAPSTRTSRLRHMQSKQQIDTARSYEKYGFYHPVIPTTPPLQQRGRRKPPSVGISIRSVNSFGNKDRTTPQSVDILGSETTSMADHLAEDADVK